MENKLEPVWGGFVGAISFLYALWASFSFYAKEILGHSGQGDPGVMGMYIILCVYFVFVMAIAVVLVGWLFTKVEAVFQRLCIALVLIGIFLVGYGVPSLLVLAISAFFFWSAYSSTKKAREDAENLDDFLKT
jgi:hypothetical protein